MQLIAALTEQLHDATGQNIALQTNRPAFSTLDELNFIGNFGAKSVDMFDEVGQQVIIDFARTLAATVSDNESFQEFFDIMKRVCEKVRSHDPKLIELFEKYTVLAESLPFNYLVGRHTLSNFELSCKMVDAFEDMILDAYRSLRGNASS